MGRPGPQGGQYQPLNRSRRLRKSTMPRCGCWSRPASRWNMGGRWISTQRWGADRRARESRSVGRWSIGALASVPGQVLLAGREPDQDVVLEGASGSTWGPAARPTQILDPGATTLRPGTLSDLVDLARLAGRLEHCDFCVMPLYPSDVPEADVPVNASMHASPQPQARHG